MQRIKTLFGAQGLVYILLSILMIVLGYASPEVVDDFRIYWMVVASSFVLGILLFISKQGESIALYLSRIVVGGLFIVSGLIKANDTIGFSYKLEEYFTAKSLGGFWEVFHDYSLGLSILISGAEVLLGIAVLIGAWPKLTSWLILGMILFFTWLTNFTSTCVTNQDLYLSVQSKLDVGDDAFLEGDFAKGRLNYERAFLKYNAMSSSYRAPIDPYVQPRMGINLEAPDTAQIRKIHQTASAEFEWECVRDCGCFGDALKGSVGRSLTPRESFYKDLFLLFYVLVIFFKQRTIRLNDTRDDLILLPATILVILLFGGGLFGWYFPTYFTLTAIALYLLVKWLTKNGKTQVWMLFIVMALLSYGFALYTYTYLPIKDYRAYKIGDNIRYNMMAADERMAIVQAGIDRGDHISKDPVTGRDTILPVKYSTEWLYRNVRTGADTIIMSADYLDSLLYRKDWFNNGYELIDADGTVHIVSTGYEAKIINLFLSQKVAHMDAEVQQDSLIADAISYGYDPGYSEKCYIMRHNTQKMEARVLGSVFKDSLYPDTVWTYVTTFDSVITPPYDEGIDVKSWLLKQPNEVWITSYDINHFNVSKAAAIKTFADEAKSKGYKIRFVVAGEHRLIQEFMEKYHFDFPYYICEDKETKIMVRSNPGILQLNEGEVVNKWSYNNIPTVDQLKME